MLTAMALASGFPAALAQALKDFKCTGHPDIPWTEQIAGCSNAIASGKLAGKDLAEAFFDRGRGNQATGAVDRAIADYDQAVRLNPNDAAVYRFRGYAYSVSQQHLQALADFDQAIRLDPTDASAHNTVAWILSNSPDKRIRDPKRAVKSATRACELSAWKQPDYLETLATACGSAGDFPSAAKWWAKANELRQTPQVK